MNNDFDPATNNRCAEPETDYQAIAENIDSEPATRRDVAEGGLLGAVGGAVVGGFAGGPLGAVIGAVVGGTASAAAVDRIDKHDHDVRQKQDTSDSPADLTDIPPNLTYYAAPGAFGTSLPGMVAPAIVDTARDSGQPPHKSTEDDTDVGPWKTGNTEDDRDVNAANSEGDLEDEDLPLDDSVPNSDFSSVPNRIYEAGRKNARTNAAADYADVPRQASGNTASEHLLAHTAPGLQAETDRRVFGGEPVMDDSSDDDNLEVSDAGELDEVETPAD